MSRNEMNYTRRWRMNYTKKIPLLPVDENEAARDGLKAYVRAVKLAIDNPDVEFEHGLTTWWPTTGAEIRQQFYEGLQGRINDAIPHTTRGGRTR